MNRDGQVLYVKNSSRLLINNRNNGPKLLRLLSGCFPNKKVEFLINDLRTNNYDLFYIINNNDLGAITACKVNPNGDVYITHVCKNPQYKKKNVFFNIFQAIKNTYGSNRRFHLKVREKNKAAIEAYKKAGFRKRYNMPITRTSNKTNYSITMNTTQIESNRLIANELYHIGYMYSTNPRTIIQLRKYLIDITRDRWLYHKTKWIKPASGTKYWMQLIYGNLAITYFVVTNQYIDSQPFVLPDSDIPISVPSINIFNYSRIGMNYKNPVDGTFSFDIFRENKIKMSFKELKKYADEVFESIYNKMISREPIPNPREATAKDYLNYVNRNFTGRGNGMNIMTFYTHNLGMYQFLAMYGYNSQTLTAIPFTGNCTVIAILRISLFERLTEGRFRDNISFISQSKIVNNKQEICHYGLRTRNMRLNERLAGGNMQKATGYAHISTMSDVSSYSKMYDVLSANSIFRAKKRATTNQGINVTRINALNALSSLIKSDMDVNTAQLHNHRLAHGPLSFTPGLNVY